MPGSAKDILPPEMNIVRMLFGTVFGRDVKVKPRSASLMMPTGTGAPVGPFVAVYGNDRPTPLGVVLFDLPLAAITSCAFSMMPPGVVNDAVRTGRLDEVMTDNFQEIMNISSRLFGRPDGPRVRFEGGYSSPALVPERVGHIIRSPRFRDDWEITVPGYGSGGIAIMTPEIGTAVAR
ncbi:MAG: hypothetical protein H6926_06035 [Chromatiales bacterium]|nr:hypothetical protein [Gammaproteobacteria bacterium]MCP5352729.1 hypothetical protein [Chromatiales bacterium]